MVVTLETFSFNMFSLRDGENVALHQIAEVTSSFDWLRRKSNLSLEDCDFWRHKEVTEKL